LENIDEKKKGGKIVSHDLVLQQASPVGFKIVVGSKETFLSNV
jgi:hypothetical protein